MLKKFDASRWWFSFRALPLVSIFIFSWHSFAPWGHCQTQVWSIAQANRLPGEIRQVSTGQIRVRDRTGHEIRMQKLQAVYRRSNAEAIASFTQAPDGRILFCTGRDANIFQLHQGQEKHIYKGDLHREWSIRHVEFDPTRNLLFFSCTPRKQEKGLVGVIAALNLRTNKTNFNWYFQIRNHEIKGTWKGQFTVTPKAVYLADDHRVYIKSSPSVMAKPLHIDQQGIRVLAKVYETGAVQYVDGSGSIKVWDRRTRRQSHLSRLPVRDVTDLAFVSMQVYPAPGRNLGSNDREAKPAPRAGKRVTIAGKVVAPGIDNFGVVELWARGNRQISSYRVGRNGRFAFENIPAGFYRVSLKRQADEFYRTEHLIRSVDARHGSPQQIVFTLR